MGAECAVTDRFRVKRRGPCAQYARLVLVLWVEAEIIRARLDNELDSQDSQSCESYPLGDETGTDFD
jgi:hypothetical protein